MANCCNYEPCEGLVTVGFMKLMVNATPVSNCTSVSIGTTATSCCDGTTNGDNYIPKYSEITGGTFAPIREIGSNPSSDKNGFTYVLPTFVNSNCCTVDVNQEALTKRHITFEYTWAEENDLQLTSNPEHCDPSYEVTETRTFTRHTIACNGSNGTPIEVNTSSIDTTVTHTGTLTRNITRNGDNWTVSFATDTVYGETVAQCNRVETYSTVDLDSYTFGISLDCPSSSIPCEGGSFTLARIEGTECSSDLSLSVTCDNDDVTTTINDSSITIDVPQNNTGYDTCKVIITPTVWGETQGSIECTFNRERCGGWSPSVTANTCNVFDATISWSSQDPPIIVHTN